MAFRPAVVEWWSDFLTKKFIIDVYVCVCVKKPEKHTRKNSEKGYIEICPPHHTTNRAKASRLLRLVVVLLKLL